MILAISDDAIEPFIKLHLKKNVNCTVIHCSAVQLIPGTIAIHPLASFAESLYALKTYQQIPLIIDVDTSLTSINIQQLPNPIYRLPQRHRVLYHALCCISGNFSTLLWQDMLKTSKDAFNFDPQVFHSYLDTIQQQIKHNPKNALTGPLSRGDNKTLNKHLEALGNTPMKQLYQAFITYFNQTESKL